MLNHSCLEVLTASSSFVDVFLCESLGLSPFQISIIKKYSRKMELFGKLRSSYLIFYLEEMWVKLIS